MTNASELTITQYVQNDTIKENIQGVLKERTSQFMTSVISLVNANESLKEADKKSVLNACLISASLSLPVNQNLGYAYIIAYKAKDGIAYAQFQMGYKGFIQLAHRTGQFKKIEVVAVYQGDTDESIMARLTSIIPPTPPSEKIIGYVSYFKLINGFEKTFYMSEQDLKKHGVKFSKNFAKYNSGLWKDDFDAMAKKTVIKLLLSKWAPLSSEMEKAIQADQAIIKGENEFEYIDNKQIDPHEESEIKENVRIKKYIAEAKTVDELNKCMDAVTGSNDATLADLYTEKQKELEAKA